MDGLPQLALVDRSAGQSFPTGLQRTIRSAIDCVGIGLHSGHAVHVTLRPAPAGTGVVFHRTDLGITIPARFDHVSDTRLCTVVSMGAACVSTVEHLMAALAACGLDNVRVDVDGPELPVLDGSSAPWMFLLDCAGSVALPAPARVIEVLCPVRVTDGEAFAELRPGVGPLQMSLSIDFSAPAIGRQAFSMTLTEDAFREELAACRTFAQAQEIAGLQAAGLALGGNLDNAIVVDGARVLNPAGLRRPDEFVRHKMLDAVGDLAMAGASIQGRFVGHRSGHALNNQVLRALFADRANWRFVQTDDMPTAVAA